jgi:hypothetical protein
MVLTKSQIRGLLVTKSKWITSDTPATPTDFFAANVPEGNTRFIVALWLPGQMVNTVRMQIMEKKEDDTYEIKFCPIPVAPADWRQIPEGSYDIESPVLRLAGGENLAASIDTVGSSLNLSLTYWDYVP